MFQSEATRYLPRVAAFLIFLHLSTVKCDVRWATGTRNDRYEDNEDFEFDDHCRIRVSHADETINNTLTQRGRYGNIEVTVDAFKETFVLDLKLNTYLFASTYVEKSVTKSGTTYHNVNLRENHCYYIGTVRNRHQSNAAVSTCTGIVGYFAVGNVSYHIEPRSGQLHGPYVVYRSLGKAKATNGCGTEHIALKNLINTAKSESRLKRSFQWPNDQDKKDKVVEVYIANDRSQYLARSADANAVLQRAKEIVNTASSAYQTLGIYLVLVGVEVWTSTDMVAVVDSDVDKTLNEWYTYRMKNINPYTYNDNAVLITNTRFFKGVVGKAIIGSICSNRFSGAVISDLSSSSAVAGSTIAHEIGHNFGLVHDTDQCSCVDKGGRCIMAAQSNPSTPATNWSSCSKEQFQTAFDKGRDICMYDVPQKLFQPTVSRCGNGIVEDGEECDCGRAPSQECNGACCNSTTCQLTAASTCASGRCCDVSSCQIFSSGTMCRQKSDDCDLAEFCNGKEPRCPQDTHKPDGTNCTVKGDYAYCYDGQCRSHSTQCQLLWGQGTQVSSSICYRQFNGKGLHYGNCGLNWLPDVAYVPCQTSDVMCGKLLCDNRGKTLSHYTDYYLLSTASVGDYTCNSVIFDFGLKTQDPGLVPNGANCGDGKMCVSQKCVSVDSLQTKKCSRQCGYNEECNNEGVCQGLFGPSDQQGDGAAKTGLIVALCIVFLVIVPLLVVGGILGYRYRHQIEEYFGGTILAKHGRYGNRSHPTVSTISHPTNQEVFSNNHLQPNSNRTQPSRSAPPPPPNSHWTQVPAMSRAPPAVPYGYDNHGAVLSATYLTQAEQNNRNLALQQTRQQPPVSTDRAGPRGRPVPPTKPTALRQVPQVRTRPEPPPRPTHVQFGPGHAAPYSYYDS